MIVIEEIGKRKIVAVIRLDDLSQAIQLTRALIAGGVTVIEFTLTNPDAVQTIADVRSAIKDDAIIGAGSIITPEQVQRVADADAQFVVSPVTKASVIQACHNHDLPTVPGAYTPTEIQTAWEMNVAAVKVFPASGLGMQYIKDVLAPLPHLRLIPTGGINNSNADEFINAGVLAIGVGSSLFNKSDLADQNWQAISQSAKKMVEAVQ